MRETNQLQNCDHDFLNRLEAALPPGTLRPAEQAELHEPRGLWHGQAGAVACPNDTAQVATIVQACAQARVGIVPMGGNTGLVGGQVMPADPAVSIADRPAEKLPLLVSLSRMNALRDVFPNEKTLVVEAGMTLHNVQKQASEAGLMFPLSLASEGSAQIGGNLATNAGGVSVLRYGNARDVCLGIEAVLPNGQIYHGLKRLRKDNMGYDLRHLLIGSEGTLGVITAAALRLFTPPAARVTAIVVVESPLAAITLLSLAERRFPGMVTAFELINRTSYEFLAQAAPHILQPFSDPPNWSVLVELSLPSVLPAEESMARLYAEGEEAGLVKAGVIAASEKQRAALWGLREAIPAANRHIGAISSHDISVPISVLPEFIIQAREKLSKLGEWRINCFGHVGDGNLHYNVFPVPGKTRADHIEQRDAIKRCVHDLVHQMGGSVSAEHGLGRAKVQDLERYADPGKLAAMRAIKQALDPLGIMNPGAVLRA